MAESYKKRKEKKYYINTKRLASDKKGRVLKKRILFVVAWVIIISWMVFIINKF